MFGQTFAFKNGVRDVFGADQTSHRQMKLIQWANALIINV